MLVVTKCLHCGKPLSFVKRLQNDRHCSEECYAQYIRKQDETALAELTRRKAAAAAAAAEGRDSAALAEEYVETEERVETEVAPGDDSIPELWRLDRPSEEAEEREEGLEERYARFLGLVEAERHYYQEILDRLPVGVAVCAEDLSLEYGNRWFRKELKLDADDLDGAKLSGLFAQEDVVPAVQTLFDDPGRGEVHVRGAVGDAGRWDLVLTSMAPRNGEGERHLLVFAERSV